MNEEEDEVDEEVQVGAGAIEEGELDQREEEEEEGVQEGGEETEDEQEEINTVKAVQEELNASHPFGIKIWKPSLYKKDRSIDEQMRKDLHSPPSLYKYDFSLGNIIWAILFGWWIGIIYLILALLLCPIYFLGLLFPSSGIPRRQPWSSLEKFGEDLRTMKLYSLVLLNLAGYIFWPFGKFIAKKYSSDTHHLHHQPSRESVQAFSLPPAQIPLLSDHDHSAPRDLEEGFHREPLPSGSGNGEFDAWSEISTTAFSRHQPRSKLFSLMLRNWRGGFSSMFFFILILLVLGPIHLLASGICFLAVLPIPMSKLNYYLLRHLLRHPLQLSAHWCEESIPPNQTPSPTPQSAPLPTLDRGSGRLRPLNPNSGRPKSVFFWRSNSELVGDEQEAHLTSEPVAANQIPFIMTTPIFNRTGNAGSNHPTATEGISKNFHIVLCTYRAMGWEYAKFTVDGINIIFINLTFAIAFTIIDFYIIGPIYNYTGIASKPLIFLSGIISTIPLSYFIGMAVSSITAQTGSVAIGSVVNATFGSIIEIILYALGLMDGKEEMVQGAMIGSFLLGLLALPGVSMFFGGLKYTQQSFNIKSTTATSTMLIVSIICVFTPTVFQNIHGTYQFECNSCPTDEEHDSKKKCQDCKIYQPYPTEDPIYQQSTKPLMYVCASLLLLTYAIGLWFTLRTHSHVVYGKAKKRKRRLRSEPSIEHLTSPTIVTRPSGPSSSSRPLSEPYIHHAHHRVVEYPKTSLPDHIIPLNLPVSPRPLDDGLRRRLPDKTHKNSVSAASNLATDEDEDSSSSDGGGNQSHENPGWSLLKSSFILMACTVAYSFIAEILIDSVDEIITLFPISQKTLGLTLIAVVPTCTEFFNAISFAMAGNIELSLEIGSAYALQVALLQIPALVAFSAFWNAKSSSLLQPLTAPPVTPHENSEFTLVFPQWEFYCLVFSTFLLTYVYLEGKSNYFKGSLLLLVYFIMITAFFFEPSSRFPPPSSNIG